MLSKASIAKAITERSTTVTLKCFQGEEARIRIPSAGELRTIFLNFKQMNPNAKAAATGKLCADCYRDENDEPIFTAEEFDQLPVPVNTEMQERLLEVLGLADKKDDSGN